jgi:biopolymer transport protein ExbB
MKILFLLNTIQSNITDSMGTSNFQGETVPTEEKLSIMQLIFDPASLWIMIPLFIMFAYTVYIFVERFFAIQRASKEEKNFMNNIRDFIHHGKIESAMALCKGNDTPLARMIEKGLTRIGKPLEDVSTAIENTGKLEIAYLEKGTPALATISGTAPMLGFLGTVIGMVIAFHAMAANPNNLNITDLASGIYTAMITTIVGLIVGIVAYFCNNYLITKITRLVNMLETKSTEFMDLLHEPV